ncbi:MAG TPA: sigma factor-like helix-turn-helix DNA-binding protein [Solirubrobacteraceae bacterium]|jgi:RNA polymerase sigma-B factor|nr:sigma factor-like helix-turn-helix DNA-binding protein [Solirubrobacteraceae bacterium]
MVGAPDAAYALVDAQLRVARLTALLNPRAREILRLRFQVDMVQSEIAERVGCSRMHVSRITRASLDRLYEYGNAQHG